MKSAKEISKSVCLTIQQVKTEYINSKLVKDLNALDSETKKRTKMDGRELMDWNAKIYRKLRRKFDTLVQAVCKRNGINEDHVRRVAGWKRGRNITSLYLNDK